MRFEHLYQWDEVAIAGDKDNGVQLGRLGNGVNGDAHVPIAFGRAVRPLFQFFDLDLVSEAQKRIEEACLIHLRLSHDIGDGPHDLSP